MIPPQVADLLRGAFAGQPIGEVAATAGGFSNLTVAATIGERRCVVKAATAPVKRADVRREARLLDLLRGGDLPIPTPLALAEDGDWTVAVTQAIAGANGLLLLERAPAELPHVYHQLGAVLAAVHRTPLAAVDADLRMSTRADAFLRAVPALPLDADPRAALAAGLAHPIWRAAPAGLVHGDAGIHNILWDGQIAALLDWEWAGWGPQLLDLAWLYWTVRWRGLPARLWQALLSGYGAGPALEHDRSSEELRALALGQIAGILVRVRGQPDAWEEWLRRLRWTCALDFPALVAT